MLNVVVWRRIATFVEDADLMSLAHVNKRTLLDACDADAVWAPHANELSVASNCAWWQRQIRVPEGETSDDMNRRGPERSYFATPPGDPIGSGRRARRDEVSITYAGPLTLTASSVQGMCELLLASHPDRFALLQCTEYRRYLALRVMHALPVSASLVLLGPDAGPAAVLESIVSNLRHERRDEGGSAGSEARLDADLRHTPWLRGACRAVLLAASELSAMRHLRSGHVAYMLESACAALLAVPIAVAHVVVPFYVHVLFSIRVRYALAPTCKAISWLFADFRGWAEYFQAWPIGFANATAAPVFAFPRDLAAANLAATSIYSGVGGDVGATLAPWAVVAAMWLAASYMTRPRHLTALTARDRRFWLVRAIAPLIDGAIAALQLLLIAQVEPLLAYATSDPPPRSFLAGAAARSPVHRSVSDFVWRLLLGERAAGAHCAVAADVAADAAVAASTISTISTNSTITTTVTNASAAASAIASAVVVCEGGPLRYNFLCTVLHQCTWWAVIGGSEHVIAVAESLSGEYTMVQGVRSACWSIWQRRHALVHDIASSVLWSLTSIAARWLLYRRGYGFEFACAVSFGLRLLGVGAGFAFVA